MAGILDLICLVRYTHLKIDALGGVVKPAIASIAMGAAAYFGYAFFSLRLSGAHASSLSTALAIAVAAVIYVALVLALRVFSPEELKLIPGGKLLSRTLYGGK